MRTWPGAQPNVFCARTQLRRVRVDCICKNVMHYDLRSRRVCFLPGAVAQLLSRSPHLNADTRLHAQAELNPFPKDLVYPLHFPFDSRL